MNRSSLKLLGGILLLHLFALSCAVASTQKSTKECNDNGIVFLGEFVGSKLNKATKKIENIRRLEALDSLSTHRSPAKIVIKGQVANGPMSVEVNLRSLKGEQQKKLKFTSKDSSVEIIAPEALGLIRVVETSKLVITVNQGKHTKCEQEIVVHAND